MAENQGPCATDEVLQQLLLGLLPRPQAACLEMHVLDCRRCGQRLAATQAEDALVEAARGQATLPHEPDDADVQRLVNYLCELTLPTMGLVSGHQVAAEEPEALRRFLAPATSADELGRIGAYRVLEVLGLGGMGIVLEAEDTQLGRRVALKVMRPLLAASPAARARFLREARAAAAVEHDHVVVIHQVGEHDGLPYLAMPLLMGESLARRVARQGRLPAAETVRIGREIAEGLAAAHQRGVVHRDIKPENIWLEAPQDRVKILDFGLARLTDDRLALTQSGTVAGTPLYMSPEQARGEGVDHRTDLFSLGCVMYRLLAGETPFSGPNATAILLAVTQQESVPLGRLVPEVPRALSGLVESLLHKDPRRRVQSATEVVSALTVLGRNVEDPRHPVRSRRRRLGALVALGIVLAGLLVLAAVVFCLTTAQGTLVLDLKDPDAAVTIDGRQVSIRAQGEAVRITLPSGSHEMLVSKDSFKAYTNHFVMGRGGQVDLEVRLEPLRGSEQKVESSPPQVAAASAPSPQREAKLEGAMPPASASKTPASGSRESSVNLAFVFDDKASTEKYWEWSDQWTFNKEGGYAPKGPDCFLRSRHSYGGNLMIDMVFDLGDARFSNTGGCWITAWGKRLLISNFPGHVEARVHIQRAGDQILFRLNGEEQRIAVEPEIGSRPTVIDIYWRSRPSHFRSIKIQAQGIEPADMSRPKPTWRG